MVWWWFAGRRLACAGQRCLGAGEDVEAEVAAAFDPFVVLFASTAPTSRVIEVRSGNAHDVGPAPNLSRGTPLSEPQNAFGNWSRPRESWVMRPSWRCG